MHTPFITLNEHGASFTTQRPVAHDPIKHDYSRRPIKVAVHRDLTLELHGANFTVTTKLSVDDALGLIGILSYAVREHTSRMPTQFVEVTK